MQVGSQSKDQFSSARKSKSPTPSRYRIPTTVVGSVDEDTVYLTGTEDDALDQGGAWGSTGVTDSVATASTTSNVAAGDLAEGPAPFVHEQEPTTSQ